MVKYAVFVNGHQVTDYELTYDEAVAVAEDYEEDGDATEIDEMDFKLEETREYWE